MKERQVCGAMFGGFTCDREKDHQGDHRGYNEMIDEPMFWPDRDRAMLDLFHWARLETPDVPEDTVRAMAHALGSFISVDEAHAALKAVQAETSR